MGWMRVAEGSVEVLEVVRIPELGKAIDPSGLVGAGRALGAEVGSTVDLKSGRGEGAVVLGALVRPEIVVVSKSAATDPTANAAATGGISHVAKVHSP
jgi:hypothetical protein